MKTLLKSFRLTLVFCIFLFVGYVLVLRGISWLIGPSSGRLETVNLDGKTIGVAQVGQLFTKDIYFWGRPSCAGAGYDASASAGSDKGPTDAAYLREVEARIDTFLVHHPYLRRSQVPSELVTAGGSGLDPDITPAGAEVQILRVALARGISEEAVRKLVAAQTEGPLWGIFGPKKVNVLKLNAALDEAYPVEKAGVTHDVRK